MKRILLSAGALLPPKAMRIGVIVALLIGAALGAAWYYGFYGFAPAPDFTSAPGLPPPLDASGVTGAPGAVTVPPPPFRVSATLLSPSQRVAHVQVLDAALQPQGPSVSVTEGETLEGYRVHSINNNRVYFEREGQLFLVHVSGDGAVHDDARPLPAQDAWSLPAALTQKQQQERAAREERKRAKEEIARQRQEPEAVAARALARQQERAAKEERWEQHKAAALTP